MLQTFAEDLKYFREKKNLTLKDVALDTRLNMSVLESIETGDFTFQPQTYIRAFLRQYAKSIGLNPDEILKDYEQAKNGRYSTKRMPEEEKPEAFEDVKADEPKLEVKKPVIVEKKEEPKQDVKTNEQKLEEKQEEVKKEEKSEHSQGEVTEEVFDNFNIDEFRRNDDEEKISVPEIKEEAKPEAKEDIKKEEKKREEVKNEEINSVETKHEDKSEEKKSQKKKSEEFNFPPPREKKPIEIQRENEDKKYTTTDPDKRYIVKTKNVNSSALKTTFIVIVFILIGVGVYSMINVLFLSDNTSTPEIQRKSFDDVVKENEKKILGKKTPQEIQDSINAEIEAQKKIYAAQHDSITLEIGAYKDGWVIVDVDSTSINDPQRTYLTKGYVETFRAKNFFHLGTPNASQIEVKLNGKLIEFNEKNFRNVRIDRTDLK